MSRSKKKKKGQSQSKQPVKYKHTHSKWTWACLALVVVLAAALVITLKTGGQEDPYGDIYYADISVRGYGVITIEMDASVAPITVGNFISLANQGFYDGLTFHRIDEGFMMQGGDPNADGTGGSGKTIKGEFAANGVDNPQSHTRGAVSMARSSDSYDSASSQFFIVHQDSTFLDGQYAAFGYVIEGMDIVDAICAAAEPINAMCLIAEDAQPIIGEIKIYQ